MCFVTIPHQPFAALKRLLSGEEFLHSLAGVTIPHQPFAALKQYFYWSKVLIHLDL